MTDRLQRAQRLKLRPEIPDGRGADLRVQGERAFAGVDHVEVGQPQIAEGGEHGAGQRRGRGPLELEPEARGLPGNMCSCRSDFMDRAKRLIEALWDTLPVFFRRAAELDAGSH